MSDADYSEIAKQHHINTDGNSSYNDEISKYALKEILFYEYR